MFWRSLFLAIVAILACLVALAIVVNEFLPDEYKSGPGYHQLEVIKISKPFAGVLLGQPDGHHLYKWSVLPIVDGWHDTLLVDLDYEGNPNAWSKGQVIPIVAEFTGETWVYSLTIHLLESTSNEVLFISSTYSRL